MNFLAFYLFILIHLSYYYCGPIVWNGFVCEDLILPESKDEIKKIYIKILFLSNPETYP